LLKRQTAEEFELGNPALAFVKCGEPRQCGIEVEDVDGLRACCSHCRIQRYPRPASRPFGHLVRASTVDKDATHHLRRQAEELSPVLPNHPVLIDQPQICLIDKFGRLKCGRMSLAAQPGCGTTTKFLVNERHQPVTRAHIATTPGAEQLGHIFGGSAHPPSCGGFY